MKKLQIVDIFLVVACVISSYYYVTGQQCAPKPTIPPKPRPLPRGLRLAIKQKMGFLHGSWEHGLRITFLPWLFKYQWVSQKKPKKRQRCRDKSKLKRKDYRQMTKKEMDTFHSCLQQLKRDGSSRGYNRLVRNHEFDLAPAAHFGMAFVGWHRHYLYELEQALRRLSKKCRCVTIPYWDSACDQPLPSPGDAATWTDEYWGAGQGVVTNGELCPNWDINKNCQDIGTRVIRSVSGDPDDLYSRDIIVNRQAASDFAELMAGFFDDGTSLFEAEHGLVHCYVGECTGNGCNGHMGCVDCSPSDPIFWLHHGFVDYIWWEWEQLPGRVSIYPSGPAPGGPLHGRNAYMAPFPGLTNNDGLRKNFYPGYYKRPSAIECTKDSDCKSPPKLLWCDKRDCCCKAKVRPGGDCTGLPDNACYCSGGTIGRCQSNRCEC